MKEFSAKNNEFDVFHSKKIFEVLHTFFYNPSHMVIEIIGETHLAFFYPLPYFQLENVNKVFAESDKFYDLSLHWIPLKQVADSDFNQKYLTAFDL